MSLISSIRWRTLPAAGWVPAALLLGGCFLHADIPVKPPVPPAASEDHKENSPPAKLPDEAAALGDWPGTSMRPTTPASRTRRSRPRRRCGSRPCALGGRASGAQCRNDRRSALRRRSPRPRRRWPCSPRGKIPTRRTSSNAGCPERRPLRPPGRDPRAGRVGRSQSLLRAIRAAQGPRRA